MDVKTLLADAAPYLALAGLILLVLGLILLFALFSAQTRRLRRLRESLSRSDAALDEIRRSVMSREETDGRLTALSQQLMISSDQTERRTQTLFGTMDERIDRMDRAQEARSSALAAALAQRLAQTDGQLEQLRGTMDKALKDMREDNVRQLTQMRETVDEKLSGTLNRRLTESFRVVSEQLESVSRGLGEMQKLAGGVDDLKKVLTNVKTRGVWGEIQLGALIGQLLTPDQYGENVQIVPDSALRVEYAVRLPGKGDAPVWLPIDSKFPLSAYERLEDAAQAGDRALVRQAEKELQDALLTEGKRISGKYVRPPYSTDFAVMFLPTEGLFAQAARSAGLLAELQEKYRVIVCGPTTLSALLCSLQVGFRTLKVEESSVELRRALSALETDFARFCELLDTARARMRQATDSIERAATRSRALESRLKNAGALPGQPPLPDADPEPLPADTDPETLPADGAELP